MTCTTGYSGSPPVLTCDAGQWTALVVVVAATAVLVMFVLMVAVVVDVVVDVVVAATAVLVVVSRLHLIPLSRKRKAKNQKS